ncbi:MAG: hypothetical protein M3O30_11895 [Planctomycetota bacterium]|nr:hypothetical protein [Planctomycetota bacterium]
MESVIRPAATLIGRATSAPVARLRLPFHFPPLRRKLAHLSNQAQSNLVGDDVVAAARSLRRSAVEKLLRANYPRVCRLAFGLCGRESAGKSVVKKIMTRSLTALPKWRNEAEAINWFSRHTVLAAREIAPSPPPPSEDCLLTRIGRPSPPYLAFVRSLRQLPSQQTEAFILFRAECLEPRQAAISMDCSTQAAANHLIAANKALAAVAADQFDAQSDTLVRVYASLTPTEDFILGQVASVGRRLTRRRLRKTIFLLITLGLGGVLAWVIWRISQMVVI